MAVVINLAALIAFLAIAVLFSHDRRAINKKNIENSTY